MYISSGEVIGSIRVKIQQFVPENFCIEPGSLLPRHGHPATLCQSTSSFQEQLKGAQSWKLLWPIALIPYPSLPVRIKSLSNR
jgi:hypothetical protein